MVRSRAITFMATLALVLAACSDAGATAPPSASSAGTSASPAAATPAAAEPVSVRIGLDSFGGAIAVYAAQQEDLFAKHGITATVDTYSVGLDTLNAALAGTADFGWAFDYGSLGAMSANQLRYVATLSRTKPGFHQLALTDRAPTPLDLAGKRMGIVTGTQQHYITIKYLEKLGIAEEDVELISFGAVLEIVAAMRTGQVDAAWVFGQGVGEAQKVKGVTLAASDGEVLPGGRGFLIATRKIVEERPDVVERVLAALIDGDEWVKANDPEFATTAAYIADQLQAPVDGVLQNIRNAEVTVSFNESDLALLEEYAAFRTTQTPDHPLDVKAYVALDPLREVDAARVTVP